MPVWMPQIGDDSLFCRRKLSNEYDEYTAAIVVIDQTSSLTCPDRKRVAKLQEQE